MSPRPESGFVTESVLERGIDAPVIVTFRWACAVAERDHDGRFLGRRRAGHPVRNQARSRRAGVLRKRDVECRRTGDVSAGVIE